MVACSNGAIAFKIFGYEQQATVEKDRFWACRLFDNSNAMEHEVLRCT